MSVISRLADDIWIAEGALEEYSVRGALVVGGERTLAWEANLRACVERP